MPTHGNPILSHCVCFIWNKIFTFAMDLTWPNPEQIIKRILMRRNCATRIVYCMPLVNHLPSSFASLCFKAISLRLRPSTAASISVPCSCNENIMSGQPRSYLHFNWHLRPWVPPSSGWSPLSSPQVAVSSFPVPPGSLPLPGVYISPQIFLPVIGALPRVHILLPLE